nr:hypothetical protein [Tanacetum cinerariifolium]
IQASKEEFPKDTYEQLDDEPLDFLDRQKTRLSLRSFDNLKRKLQSDEEPELDVDGRLIIREDGTTLKIKSGWAYTGSEYSSRKAGGDLKMKGKLEPNAYWPLDRKMVSRRPEHKATTRKGMSSVVKLKKRLEG